jgi:mono/diheme cytochrome c family protein
MTAEGAVAKLSLLSALLGGLVNCSGFTPEPPSASPTFPDDLGVKTYQQYCLACHQADGSGVPGMYPPLKATEWVDGDTERLIRIVLYGLAGPIEVDGEQYDQVMAASDFLSDEEVAAVLTYVRSEFGKNGSPVSPAEVAVERRKQEPAQDFSDR